MHFESDVSRAQRPLLQFSPARQAELCTAPLEVVELMRWLDDRLMMLSPRILYRDDGVTPPAYLHHLA